MTTKLNSIVEVSKPEGMAYRAFAESRGPEGGDKKRRSGPLRTFDGRAHVPPLKFPERAEHDGVSDLLSPRNLRSTSQPRPRGQNGIRDDGRLLEQGSELHAARRQEARRAASHPDKIRTIEALTSDGAYRTQALRQPGAATQPRHGDAAQLQGPDSTKLEGAPLVQIDERPSSHQSQHSQQSQGEDREFNDSLQQFVDLMKLITQATQINVYSKELVQIYNDARGRRIVALTDE